MLTALRRYVSLIKAAQDAGYKVTLLFIWIDSPLTAIQRVAERVVKGGHNIPSEVIERRYYRGLFNFTEPIAEGGLNIDNRASRKLVEESAAQGRSLVVCIDGEVKKISAKDLLSKVSETN